MNGSYDEYSAAVSFVSTPGTFWGTFTRPNVLTVILKISHVLFYIEGRRLQIG